MNWIALLGQATQPGAAPHTPSASEAFWGVWFPLILVLGVFYYFMFRSQRTERQKHQSMLNSLKRGDRVQTIGGILGAVVDVRENEVILKVDENANVRVRFNRSAIKEVLSRGDANETKSS